MIFVSSGLFAKEYVLDRIHENVLKILVTSKAGSWNLATATRDPAPESESVVHPAICLECDANCRVSPARVSHTAQGVHGHKVDTGCHKYTGCHKKIDNTGDVTRVTPSTPYSAVGTDEALIKPSPGQDTGGHLSSSAAQGLLLLHWKHHIILPLNGRFNEALSVPVRSSLYIESPWPRYGQGSWQWQVCISPYPAHGHWWSHQAAGAYSIFI